MNKIGSERRKHPRLTNNIAVKLSTTDFDAVTETINLSCSGVYCRVNQHIPPMTKLKLLLLIPIKSTSGIKVRKITCQGVVVRVEPEAHRQAGATKNFHIAIYFNDISPRDVKYIGEYINSALDQKVGKI